MANEKAENLMRAIEEYEKEFGGDPKFRRALVGLDDARQSIERLEVSYESPGRDAARDVSYKDDATREQRDQREPSRDSGPRDYDTAGAMARERFAANSEPA